MNFKKNLKQFCEESEKYFLTRDYFVNSCAIQKSVDSIISDKVNCDIFCLIYSILKSRKI